MITNIVMLHKNRHRLFLQAIQSLYRHTPLDSFNLTIIDDASDHMEAWASINQGQLETGIDRSQNSAYLRIERSKGITGQARNLGVYWAEKYWGRGDFLYLSDNDVYFTKDWLDTLIDTIAFPGVKLIGGSTHPFHGINEAFRTSVQHPGREVRIHDAVAGYSQLMRWETWDTHGPLDAHAPGIRQSEDFKFCQDIVKAGGKVGTVWPEVVYNTGLTDTYGKPAIGQDVMRRYPGVIQE